MPNEDQTTWPLGYDRLRRRAVTDIKGDKVISVNRNGETFTISLSIDALRPFFPKGGGGGSITKGQYQGMGYFMVSDNQAGWAFPFLVPEL